MSDRDPPPADDRRGFLAKLLMGGGLVGSGLLAARHGLAFVFPRLEPPTFRKLLVARVGDLAPGQAKELRIGGQPLFLVNSGDGYAVFNGTCTHLGCKVKWEAHRDRFYCPCHQGVFGSDGEVVEGPPPRPLDRYRVEAQDELIYMWMEEPGSGGLT